MSKVLRNVGVTTFAVVAVAFLALPANAAGVVYIPLGSAGEVVVVDTKKDTVVAKIKNVPAVHGLAGTPDGRFLIAGSYAEREVGDAAPKKPLGVTEDEHASHHASPTSSAQELNSTISTVSIIRTDDRSVVRRVDVPGAVHHVAVSPNGQLAVVTHPNEGRISAIDLSSRQVLATAETGPLPNYAVFGPGGDRVYVSNAGNETVSVIDTRSWVSLQNIVVGVSPEHVVLSKDGATLFVNNVDDGTVSVISTAQGKVIKTIDVGSTPHGIDLSDDGRTLYVAALGDDKLVAVDLATGSSRRVVLTPEPYHLSAIRGAGKLYVSSADQPKVWVVDQKSLAILGTIEIGGKGHQMVQGAGI